MLAALAVRLIVPAGMMPGHGTGGTTLIVCPGHTAMPGMAMPPAKEGVAKGHPAKDVPCAFTDLLAAALDGPALPVLPAMPLPVAVLIVAGAAAVVRRSRRLRPPLRGPPALLTA